MTPHLLLIGGGNMQLPVVDYAHRLGVKVLCFDGNPGAPARTRADWFTVADIILYCALEFGAGVKQPLDPSLKNVNAWFKRVDSRPSAKSSLHPASATTGMKG